MTVLLYTWESQLILLLGTSLVAVKTNRFLYVLLFLIVSYILYGFLLSSYSLKGISAGFVIGFSADLIAGTSFYLYTKRYLAKKPDEQAQRIKRIISKWLSGLLCLALICTIGLVYLGIQRWRETTDTSQAEVLPQNAGDTKQTISSHTAETTGFGIIRDPMLWNPLSGKPTSLNSEER
jgi:hypothetical protein